MNAHSKSNISLIVTLIRHSSLQYLTQTAECLRRDFFLHSLIVFFPVDFKLLDNDVFNQ